MECDDVDSGAVNISADEENRIAAVNSTILEYYKKFGRKRDLEQYFSLSTAQSEIRDPTSLFWRRMKTQNESSDSGERSSTELCRISIKCSVAGQEPTSSQDDKLKTKSDSESPPIITEDIHDTSRHSDDESGKSDDDRSQKSVDATFDTSMNKLLSPTSSITSQRKLEWDSLADVGYANETDRKNSASSLSTLERLALKQQYSNNDTKHSDFGPPTAHSTPLDEIESKSKGKKGLGKITKIYRKDIDCVEVNMPHSSERNPAQAINVNLTKHISFNVDGGITVDNIKKDLSVTPEKVSVETEVTPLIKSDKEIQTSLTKSKEKSTSSVEMPKTAQVYGQGLPVLINLNTLKKRNRRRKVKTVRKKLRNKNRMYANKENVPVLEKSGDQVSEAESFEYMPGHIYNQNQRSNESRPSNTAGNKSSLESSGALTTDSSKNIKKSFSKDLEKSINLLRAALQKRYDDSDLKKKLVKEVVQRLLKSSYRDDESTTDFLSGLSFSSKKIGLGLGEGNTTTSTSDANNTDDKPKSIRPKKSILRIDKFNANAISSTSQSAPNLPSVSNCEKLVTSKLNKPPISSNTESDVSSRDKNSSDTAFAKTSSEELYQKYIHALKREEAYKKHLRDKEMFLKQKLVYSESALKVPARLDVKSQNRLKDLMKDLTRNNYDDGSGDASKLEGGSNSNTDFMRPNIMRNHRSHSVFTLSSGNSDCQSRKSNLKRTEKDSPKAGTSKDQQHYCCCPFHSTNNKIGLTDSSVQVDIKQDNQQSSGNKELKQAEIANCNKQITRVVSDDMTGEIKYVCLCNNEVKDLQELNDNFLVYKCSRLSNKGMQSQEATSNTVSVQCKHDCPHSGNNNEKCTTKLEENKNQCFKTNVNQCFKIECKNVYAIPEIKSSKSSQTNIACKCYSTENVKEKVNVLHEATRCLQTEISINPRITEPSLSDISIVSDADCATCINEQYRVVSKSNSQCNVYKHARSKEPKENLNKCEYRNTKIDKEMQSDNEQTYENKSRSQIANVPDSVTDKFRIPIQGTNMTLMVSIGTNADRPGYEISNKEVVTQAVITDAINTNENATCLREECSKGVQSVELSNPCFNANKGNLCLVNTLFTREGFYKNIYSNEDMQLNIQSENPMGNTDKSSSEKGCGIQTELLDNFFATESQINDCQKLDNRNAIRICNTYPKVELNVKKPLIRSDTGYVEKILTSRHKKPFPQENVEKELTCIINEPSIKTDKFSCPETARCKGNCGADFDCVNQKPFPRSNSDRDNEKIDIDPCVSSNQNTHKRRKWENKEKELTRVINETSVKKDNLNQPFLRSNSDRDSEKIDKDSCVSSNQNKQKRSKWEIIEKELTCAINEPSDKKDKCICPETARCKGNCGADFDCADQRPLSNSDRDNETIYKDLSYVSSVKSTMKKTECTCPETAKCKGECGPNSDCVNQRPCSNLTREIDRKEKETSDCSDQNTKKKSKCSCPDTAGCKGNCGADFDCVNQRPFPRSNSDEDGEKIDEDSCVSSNQNTQKKSKWENIEKELTCVINEPSVKKDKCSCPETARCKGNCGADFDCVNQRPLIRTNTDRCDSEYNTQFDRDIIDDTINRIIKKKTNCSCPESAKCGGTCGENAECRKRILEIQPGSKDVKHLVHSNTTSGKQCYIQTDRVEIKNRETQKEYSTDQSEPGKLKCYEPESTSTETKSRSTSEEQSKSNSKNSQENDSSKVGVSKDLILEMIKDITKKYSKKDIEKSQRKKCFNEIMTILKYLLDNDEGTDYETIKAMSNDCRVETDSDGNTKKVKETSESGQVASSSCNDEERVYNAKISREKPSCSVYNSRVKREVKDRDKTVESSTTPESDFGYISKQQVQETTACNQKILVDKAVQLSLKKTKSSRICKTESSDMPVSTDCHGTSSDSATCKVLSKIKKECEKYHQKRCKCYHTKKCDGSSSTSVNCDQCKRIHYCLCRSHKCKNHRSKSFVEKVKKKCVAYNLIIQTSESMISEETACDCNNKPLQNIVVKVPKRNKMENVPFKEVSAKIERLLPCCSPRSDCRTHRSRSLPKESCMSSTDDCIKKSKVFTVRDYLETNRPDFVEQCTKRQHCLKMIGETRASQRASYRELLSLQLQLDGQPSLNALSDTNLRRLARELGVDLRRKTVAPKFISEREMKKHSEKIYKSLPEVVQKKEELKKEGIKKTNLLMANIFKKNLQKKTLRGSVNLSNYNTVIKI